MHAHERHLLLHFLSALLRDTQPGSEAACRYAAWLDRHGPDCRIDAVQPAPPSAPRNDSNARDRHPDWPDRAIERHRALAAPGQWERVVAHVARQRDRSRPGRPSRLARNLALLCGLLNLPPREAKLLAFLARIQETPAMRALLADDDHGLVTFRRLREGATVVTGSTLRQVSQMLRSDGMLARAGLFGDMDFDMHLHARDSVQLLNRRITEALRGNPRDAAALSALIVGTPVAAQLVEDDFDHVADDRNLVRRLLAGAIAKRQRGVNVLLYGDTGTGKTEFCRVVARAAGASLHDVTHADDDGAQASGYERLSALRVLSTLLAGRQDAVLLFDEMEDLLASAPRPRHGIHFMNNDSTLSSKGYFNALLENTRTPILWTSNSIATLDPAFLRRMTCVVELKAPPRAARVRIWERTLARHRVRLDTFDVQRLASTHGLSPGFVKNAVVAARLTGDREVISHVLDNAAMAIGARQPRVDPFRTVVHFDTSLARCDQDIGRLTAALVRAPERRFGLCLYGPPGTGKSAYARWLAQELGLDVLFRRASDLLGKYVGESEQNIAEMFRQAIDDGSMLVIDEADSLLRDRSHAIRNWEVTQVNEMLTWMEEHPLPFVFTTNLVEGLDRAAMRRFTFKAKFDYLDGAQSARAFRTFFGAEAPAELARLDRLTPGDFQVVRRRASILGVQEPRALLAFLREEVAHKLDGGARPIGFAP